MGTLLALFVVILAAVQAAPSPKTPEDDVRAVVRQAIDGLENRDTATLTSVFDPSANLILVSDKDGQGSLTVVPVKAILSSLANPGPRRRERMKNERVLINGDFATVAADYVFYFDDVLHHCGVAMYDLARIDNRWRITQIRETDRRTGCTP